MKPVRPDETRRERALFAARLHVRSGTELSAEAVKEICEELLDDDFEEQRSSTVPTSAPIEPGKYTESGERHG